jgi:hypothetical protein
MKNIFKFLGIIALAAVIGFSFVGCGARVIELADGSQGIAGDGEITRLTSGRNYIGIVDGDIYNIAWNGTLGWLASDLTEAVQNINGESPFMGINPILAIAPLDAGVQWITGLTNGETYDIYIFVGANPGGNPIDFEPLEWDDVIGTNPGAVGETFGKNAIIDLSDPGSGWVTGESIQVIRGAGAADGLTRLIFYVGTANPVDLSNVGDGTLTRINNMRMGIADTFAAGATPFGATRHIPFVNAAIQAEDGVPASFVAEQGDFFDVGAYGTGLIEYFEYTTAAFNAMVGANRPAAGGFDRAPGNLFAIDALAGTIVPGTGWRISMDADTDGARFARITMVDGEPFFTITNVCNRTTLRFTREDGTQFDPTSNMAAP